MTDPQTTPEFEKLMAYAAADDDKLMGVFVLAFWPCVALIGYAAWIFL